MLDGDRPRLVAEACDRHADRVRRQEGPQAVAAPVLVDPHEARPRRPHGPPEPADEALDEAGLARAELADQRDDGARAERPSEPLARGRRLLGAPPPPPHPPPPPAPRPPP